MPTLAAERFLTKRPTYFVGVKRDGLPWHRLAQMSSLELALDFIHNDAISQGHWATDSLERRGADAWLTHAAEDTYDIWCTPSQDAERMQALFGTIWVNDESWSKDGRTMTRCYRSERIL